MADANQTSDRNARERNLGFVMNRLDTVIRACIPIVLRLILTNGVTKKNTLPSDQFALSPADVLKVSL